MPAAYRTCTSCVPARKRQGWMTCRACRETLPSAASGGNKHGPHCAIDRVPGRRTCANCGARCL
eukprot:738022-Prorocentrum_lima.AAC.1